MARFNQESYKAFTTFEQLLLKGIENQRYEEDLAKLKTIYGDDVDTSPLATIDKLTIFTHDAAAQLITDSTTDLAINRVLAWVLQTPLDGSFPIQ